MFIKKEPLSLDDELKRRSVFNSLALATKVPHHAARRFFRADSWYAAKGKKLIPVKRNDELMGTMSKKTCVMTQSEAGDTALNASAA